MNRDDECAILLTTIFQIYHDSFIGGRFDLIDMIYCG